MTKNDVLPRTRSFVGLLRDLVWVCVMTGAVILPMLAGLYYLNKSWIVPAIRAELGIDQLATAHSVDQLKDAIRDLEDAVRAAAGEDRVIRQPRGQSYIAEPVTQGQDVSLFLVIERTNYGKECRFTGGTSIFTDASNVATTGSRITPSRQIGPDASRIRVDLTPPDSLLVGRVEVYLALEYLCGGMTVFDKTDTVSYRLLPSE